MSHTIHDKEKLLARIRRLKGQMEAVERALEDARPCNCSPRYAARFPA